MMAGNVGVWIDHRNAILVRLDTSGESVESIVSGVEKHTREMGGSHGSTPFSPQHNPVGKQERQFYQHLDQYYDKVIDRLDAADALWVLGPGEAKLEFEKRLSRHESLYSRLDGVEPADSMTVPQFVAKVRAHFQA